MASSEFWGCFLEKGWSTKRVVLWQSATHLVVALSNWVRDNWFYWLPNIRRPRPSYETKNKHESKNGSIQKRSPRGPSPWGGSGGPLHKGFWAVSYLSWGGSGGPAGDWRGRWQGTSEAYFWRGAVFWRVVLKLPRKSPAQLGVPRTPGRYHGQTAIFFCQFL